MAAKNKDPGPVLSLGGGAFVDTLGLHDNTAAIVRLAGAIEHIDETIEHVGEQLEARSESRVIRLLEETLGRKA